MARGYGTVPLPVPRLAPNRAGSRRQALGGLQHSPARENGFVIWRKIPPLVPSLVARQQRRPTAAFRSTTAKSGLLPERCCGGAAFVSGTWAFPNAVRLSWAVPNIASGFGFLANTAGFDINQSLILYGGATSTYGDAFVGVACHLPVAGYRSCWPRSSASW